MPAASQPQHIARFVRNFVRKLRDAGIPEPAAEAVGEEMEQVVIREELDGLATKSDLQAVRAELKSEMRELRAEMREMEARILLAISESARKQNMTNLAIAGLAVAVIVLLLR